MKALKNLFLFLFNNSFFPGSLMKTWCFTLFRSFFIPFLLCTGLLMFLCSKLASQDFRFSRISLSSGLSQTGVYAITQDTAGFLWFGTQDGLNRYDGYAIKVYSPIPDDTTSLSNTTIRALFTDHTGTLWIGTEGGLNRYNPERNDFTQFRNNPDDSLSLSNNFVTTIFEDTQGNLWIGTKG